MEAGDLALGFFRTFDRILNFGYNEWAPVDTFRFIRLLFRHPELHVIGNTSKAVTTEPVF